MEPAPYINAAFTPSAAPQGTSELDHLNKGLYAYVNAAHDPELKKQADTIFGRTVPFDNSEETATLLGRSWCSRSGYLADPVRYCRDNKLPLPPNWSGENAQLYTLIGQNYIGKAQEHFNNQKAAREKALADAQKDYTETMGELPSLLAKSIRSAGGEKGTPLTPQYLEKLTKYGAREGAIQSQQRAATAWMYMSAYMDDIDSMQSTGRDKLLDIANTLSDDKGQLDPHATAAFLMMMEDKATELQSTDSQFWADFADKFQNSLSRSADQIGKAYTNKGKGWNSSIINPSFIVSTNPELDPNWLASQDNEPDPTYNDPRVEQLYGYMQRAINTAIAPSEKAEWYAKLLSEMGGLVGESAIPMALGIAASAATAGAGGGAFLAAAAGYGAGFAATAPSTINASIAEAYAQGKVNPELYGTLEGIGQAAAENIGGPATSLKLFTKTAGKITNWAASRTAGSRFLANQYARTTLNYLTAGAFESLTELGEEELGGYIGSRLNALAREMGATVSPQAYKLGETLSNMKAHEVAAIFGYSYALGLWGIPANYRSARTFAQNTDNLLKAGHTPATARDIQHRAFHTEDKIADIAANPNLSPEQKAEAIRKEEQDFCVYQQNKFNNEILSDPNLRSRLQKEGRDIRDEAEVALDVEHEADLQILKDNGILQAVIIPGQKYQVAFLEEGETKEDGTRAPGKLITQEWSRTQLTNWLMLQKNTRIEQDLRRFNSLLLAHAHAQSATPEETKTHFQNLGANRPLAALGELHKRGITPDFFRKAAEHALALQTQHENAGMSPQEAAQQPHPDFAGLSLGEVRNLSTDAATRKEQELATTGQLQSINATTDIEYGALNILRRDGTGLIKYVAGKANLLDILEERFEIDIKQRTRGNKQLSDQLAQTLLHIQSHLPGNIRLLDPAKKGRYTQSDFVEAYSKIAIGNFLLNQQNLPINPAGHRLVQNIARAVDTTRMFQTIGNAWLAYANSPEGKAHLEESGHSIADIMREAGFTFSNQIAQARATADQRTEVLQASNWQPAIEDELDALLEDIEAEEQLSEINEQEANQPTTIPAEESITGQEIVIEPDASEATTAPATTSTSEATTAPTSEATTTPATTPTSEAATTPATTSTSEDTTAPTSEATTTPATTSSEHGTSAPTTIPATDLSGEKASTILSSLRDLIAKGKARAEHFAIVFREIPGLTEAQAIEQGIRPLTQRGTPTATYTQGRLIAANLTPQQFEDYLNGKLKGKALKQALSEPSASANFSIIGPRAKTWDKYVQDGRVFKGRDDGMLRAEIDDSKAKLITNFRNIQDLEDILVHPELFDAYPELRDITVIVKDLANFEYPASAYRNGSIITLSSDYVRMSDADEILGTLLHEIGHYIQEKEEFLSGGNPSSARFLLKKLIQQAESKDSEYWLDVLSEKESILKEAKRLKKEIEQYEQSTPDDNSLPSKIKNQTDQLEKTVKSYNERINSKEPENGSFAATYLPSCDSYLSINLMKDELDYIIEYANVHQNDFVSFREEMQRRIKNRSTLLERYKNLESLSDEELYLRIPGEIESRNVANRRAWNEEERTLRPFNETLEYASESLSTFSIKPAAADTLDRFTADPLGERIIHHIRTEARRYARLLGDKTPYEQAVNAAQSAASIISAVDKYLHTPGKPVPARYRRQLQKLRSIAEKYAQIIASGTPRSFKKISPQEKQELEAAIAELEAQELDTATTESDQLLTDSDRLTKREAAARAREHHRAIVRSAAKGRVYQTLSSMLEVTADALDSYLKHQLLQKLDRLTATVKIKRSPSKRLQGKMTAPAYRELERAINLMALSDRAYQDEIENVITAHETLARAINENRDNLTGGNALLIQLADQLTTSGQQVTPQTLTAALANHEAALKIYGNVNSKNYEQTRLMANALFYLIRNGRNQWKAKHEAREAFIQQYLQHFLAHTPATSGTEQTARLAKEKEQKGTGFTRFANSMMNSTQLFHALSGIEALAPLMEHTKQALATAGVARDLHMKQMVEQVQAAYGRILGIKPATTAGYSQRQLKEISAKLDKFYEQNNQVEQTNITRHYIDADGNHQTEQLKLTKWQALDLILTYRQQHYRPNAQEHGYTDELLAQLENWCGEDLLTLGNAMQQSIPNDGTIPVYEEREGIPLRDNPLYWPAHLNIAEQETPDHPAISNPYHAAGSYRFLKGRTSNLREVAARNAYNVWKSAIAERANYVYLAPITDTLNSLLARKEFAARLKTLIGPSLYEQLKLTLKEIDGTTWAETSLQEDPHGAIARTLRNMAPALLAGNPTTLIKQSSAIANATLMPDFPPHEFAKQLIKLQQNQSGITIGQILRLDTFKARVRDNSALNDMLALGTDAKYSTYANLARSWMGLIDATDTFFNAIGATLYYNHKYEQYTKENQENGSPLTQAEIHAKCETDITVMLSLTAQPLKRTDKSAFFWRNSKTLLGPLYLYMGSEMINKVGMARANWLKRKAQGMGAAQNTLNWMYQLGAGVGGVAFLTSIACAFLTGNTPDDDDSLSAWLIATYLHSAFGQYTSQMPVIGQIIDLALSPYAQFIDGVADFPGVKTATAAKKLGTMITDDKTYSGAEWQTQINRLARDLNGITGYWGGVNSQTRWLTVTSSILQTFTAASNWITPIAKGATHDAFFADWLPDWYTQTDTRSPRRPKSLIEQWLTPDTEESPRRARRRSTARRTTPRKRKRQEE